MRVKRFWVAAGSFTMLCAGALVQQACSTGNYCTTSGDVTTCFLYTDQVPEAGSATGSGTGTVQMSTMVLEAGCAAGDGGGVTPAIPGSGSACDAGPGNFPVSTCNPSDNMNCNTTMSPMCTISPVCGDPNTCEPFVTNPPPCNGVDNFRMRVISLTAPAALANATVQTGVVTPAVDLPADGGACGENGTGLFNWLISVDKTKGTVTTGGAPPSSDPFTTGYCYLKAVDPTAGGPVDIGAATVDAGFEETTSGLVFSTTPLKGLLNIPIFLPNTNLQGVVLLPIRGAAFNNVTISANGNCIGSVNNLSILPSSGGPCVDPAPFGNDSCARWNTAGSFAGYITLKEADNVPVANLGGESLCVLLTGDRNTANPPHCTATGLTAGNYCSTTLQPGGCNDSVWLSAEFAASAVNVIQGDSGVPLCNGATLMPTTN